MIAVTPVDLHPAVIGIVMPLGIGVLMARLGAA